MIKKLLVPVLAAMTGGAVSTPLFAAEQIWNIDSSDGFTGGNTFGNSVTLSNPGVNLSISGWSNTAGNANDGDDETLEQTRLIYYGNSLGMQNQDEGTGTPNHAIDSYDDAGGDNANDFDAALLSFSTEVDLQGIQLGWAREDYVSGSNQGTSSADVSILAYTGPGSFSGSFAPTATWANILDSGWSVIANKGDLAQNSYHAITTAVESKHWLVSVYNRAFGETWSQNNDGFKLAGARTQTTSRPPSGEVPNPGSLALILSGGLILIRRRRRDRSAGVMTA